MRAKFRVNSVTDYGNGVKEAKLSAVYGDGNPENNQFSKATPSGSITIVIDNPAASNFLKTGNDYYVDFMLCPDQQG